MNIKEELELRKQKKKFANSKTIDALRRMQLRNIEKQITAIANKNKGLFWKEVIKNNSTTRRTLDTDFKVLMEIGVLKKVEPKEAQEKLKKKYNGQITYYQWNEKDLLVQESKKVLSPCFISIQILLLFRVLLVSFFHSF